MALRGTTARHRERYRARFLTFIWQVGAAPTTCASARSGLARLRYRGNILLSLRLCSSARLLSGSFAMDVVLRTAGCSRPPRRNNNGCWVSHFGGRGIARRRAALHDDAQLTSNMLHGARFRRLFTCAGHGCACAWHMFAAIWYAVSFISCTYWCLFLWDMRHVSAALAADACRTVTRAFACALYCARYAIAASAFRISAGYTSPRLAASLDHYVPECARLPRGFVVCYAGWNASYHRGLSLRATISSRFVMNDWRGWPWRTAWTAGRDL